MKRKVQGIPTIPRQLFQCDACTLGKHSKQHFHDSMFRASRNLGLIHSDLCGLMLVPSRSGNKYIMTFIDVFTRMCWVYLLKAKYQAFDTLEIFICGLKMKLNPILELLELIMVVNIHLKILKNICRRMVLNIKPLFLITHNKMVWQNV